MRRSSSGCTGSEVRGARSHWRHRDQTPARINGQLISQAPRDGVVIDPKTDKVIMIFEPQTGDKMSLSALGPAPPLVAGTVHVGICVRAARSRSPPCAARLRAVDQAGARSTQPDSAAPEPRNCPNRLGMARRAARNEAIVSIMKAGDCKTNSPDRAPPKLHRPYFGRTITIDGGRFWLRRPAIP